MGILSVLQKAYKGQGQARILILGLDNAGKTTILRRLSDEDTSSIVPTQGFNVKEVMYGGFRLTLWDVGGQKSARPFWSNYFDDCDAVVYVIDSADSNRIKESGGELQELLSEERLRGVPLLIFANKQDLILAKSIEEITTSLNLASIADRDWAVKSSCATNNIGLEEGMEWLVDHCCRKSADELAKAAGAEAPGMNVVEEPLMNVGNNPFLLSTNGINSNNNVQVNYIRTANLRRVQPPPSAPCLCQ